MAKTLKFSYPMILFIFLFLVAYKIEGNPYFDPFKSSFFTLWFGSYTNFISFFFFCKFFYCSTN
ncbi:putative Late nodulin [Medicago truncatula]|uniref:Putative Late nodulin n=1 Tax=Medicago truncatula TaxID=3880 RepID=A0A396HTZ5_MEDTR|nr:putative Late nodulin [Medicago truncatula]